MAEIPTEFTSERYISERLKAYQAWYDKKAVACKARYLRMRAFSVVGGGLVPVLVNVQDKLIAYGWPLGQLTVTAISLLVVIAVSLESVFHYREQWKNYRSTEQTLGHEEVMYRAKVGPYKALSSESAFLTLVERVENYIAAENVATLSVMTVSAEAADQAKQRTP
jgi:hypothetical protein